MTFKLMKLASQSQLSSWLPSIHPQVWIFAIGRFLSEVGTGWLYVVLCAHIFCQSSWFIYNQCWRSFGVARRFPALWRGL
jgi:hypothetical protein